MDDNNNNNNNKRYELTVDGKPRTVRADAFHNNIDAFTQQMPDASVKMKGSDGSLKDVKLSDLSDAYDQGYNYVETDKPVYVNHPQPAAKSPVATQSAPAPKPVQTTTAPVQQQKSVPAPIPTPITTQGAGYIPPAPVLQPIAPATAQPQQPVQQQQPQPQQPQSWRDKPILTNWQSSTPAVPSTLGNVADKLYGIYANQFGKTAPGQPSAYARTLDSALKMGLQDDEDFSTTRQLVGQVDKAFLTNTAQQAASDIVSQLPSQSQDPLADLRNAYYNHDVQQKISQIAGASGTSYKDFVDMQLKPAISKALQAKGLDPTDADSLFDNPDYVDRELNQRDANAMVQKQLQGPVDAAIAKFDNLAQQAEGASLQGVGQRIAGMPEGSRLGELGEAVQQGNAAKDPKKILDYLSGQLKDIVSNPGFVNNVRVAAKAAGMSANDYYRSYIAPQLENSVKSEFNREAISKLLPKDGLDYVLKTGLGNSIAGQIARKVTASDYQNWLQDMADSKYDAGFWDKVGSGAVTFGADLWSYLLPGAVGGKVTRGMVGDAESRLADGLISKGMDRNVAERAARVLVSKSKALKLATGAVSGAATFGGQSVLSTPANEIYKNGQPDTNSPGGTYHTSPGKILAKTISNAGQGAILGAVMQGSNVAGMLTKGKGLAANIAGDLAGTAADASLMGTQDILQHMSQDPDFHPTGKDAAKSFAQSFISLKMLGLPQTIGKFAGFRDKAEFDRKYDLGNEDLNILKNRGYQNLYDAFLNLGANGAEGPELKQKDVELVKQLTPQYQRFISDPSIPETTKAKMMGVIEGKRPSAFSPVTDSEVRKNDDGSSTLTTYNQDGGIIDQRRYSTPEQADKANKSLDYAKDLNVTSALQRLYANATVQQEIAQKYNDVAAKVNANKPLSDDEKRAVYMYQHKDEITGIINKMQSGTGLSPEEQSIFDAYSGFYNAMLDDSKATQQFTDNFEQSNGLPKGYVAQALLGHDKDEAGDLAQINNDNVVNKSNHYRTGAEQKAVTAYQKALQSAVTTSVNVNADKSDYPTVQQQAAEGGPESTPVPPTNPQESEETSGAASNPDATTPPTQQQPVEQPTQPQPQQPQQPSPQTTTSNGAAPEQHGREKAYDIGASVSNDQSVLPKINYEVNLADARMAAQFPDTNPRNRQIRNEIIKAVENGDDDAADKVMQQHGQSLTPSQRQAVEAYRNSQEMQRGVEDSISAQAQQFANERRAQLTPYAQPDGTITPLTLEDNSTVYYQSGDLTNAYGGIMAINENGQPVQVPVHSIITTGVPYTVDDTVDQDTDDYTQQLENSYHSLATSSQMIPGSPTDLSVGGKLFHATFMQPVNDQNGNNLLQFQAEDGSMFTLSPDDATKAVEEAGNQKIAAQLNQEQTSAQEQASKERLSKGIAGLAVGKPDFSAKETDPKVAAEYLGSQKDLNRKDILKTIQEHKDNLKNKETNIRLNLDRAEKWAAANDDMSTPEEKEADEKKISSMKEELANLSDRQRKWGEIRNAYMTPGENMELVNARSAKVAAAQSKSELTPIQKQEVKNIDQKYLLDNYASQDDASDYLQNRRRTLLKQYRNDISPAITNIVSKLDDYKQGLTEPSDSEIRDYTRQLDEREKQSDAILDQINQIKAQEKNLSRIYSTRNTEQMKELSPETQRLEKLKKAKSYGDLVKIAKEVYKNTSAKSIIDDMEPHSLEEYVAENLPAHSINWEGRDVDDVHRRGLQEELGLSRGIGKGRDTNAINYFLAPKGQGESSETAVHKIWEDRPPEFESATTEDIKDAMLNLFLSAKNPSDITRLVPNNRIAQAEEYLRAEDEEIKELEQEDLDRQRKEKDIYQDYLDSMSAEVPSKEIEDYLSGLYADEAEKIKEERTIIDDAVRQMIAESEKDTANGKDIKQGSSAPGSGQVDQEPQRTAVDSGSSEGKNPMQGKTPPDKEPSIVNSRQPEAQPGETSVSTGNSSPDRSLHLSEETQPGEISQKKATFYPPVQEGDMYVLEPTAAFDNTAKAKLHAVAEASGAFVNDEGKAFEIAFGNKDTADKFYKDVILSDQSPLIPFSIRLADAKSDVDTHPTDGQKEAGNYRHGHLRFGGYDFTIENPKGSVRSGKDKNGKTWKTTMHDTYGYILGKKDTDGDHIDMFLNDNVDLDAWNGDVYVVDQKNPDGSFDEHKVMYGFDSEDAARKAYLSNYAPGWKGLGNITAVSKDVFDKWLGDSDRKTKPFADYKRIQEASEKEEQTPQKKPSIDSILDEVDKRKVEGNKKTEENSLEKNNEPKKELSLHSKSQENENSESNSERASRNRPEILGGLDEIGIQLEKAGRKGKEASSRNLTDRIDKERAAAENLAANKGSLMTLNDLFALGDIGPSGTESDTYFSTDGYVYKMNNLMHDPLISDYLQRLSLHNKIFTNTPYELVGFVKSGQNIYPVVRQRVVNFDRLASEKEINNYMQSLGYMADGDGIFHNNKYTIKDVKPKNVFKGRDGQIYVVDAEISQNKLAEKTTPIDNILNEVDRRRKIEGNDKTEENPLEKSNGPKKELSLSTGTTLKEDGKGTERSDDRTLERGVRKESSDMGTNAPESDGRIRTKGDRNSNPARRSEELSYKNGRKPTRRISGTVTERGLFDAGDFGDSQSESSREVRPSGTDARPDRRRTPAEGNQQNSGQGLSEKIQGESTTSNVRLDNKSIKTAAEKAAPLNTRNYLYPDNAGDFDNFTPSQRLKANIKAVSILRDCLREGRQATEPERVELGKFRGWGGTDAIEWYNLDVMKRYQDAKPLAELIEELDPDGKKNLLGKIREAALTSYYTPVDVARSINHFLDRAGYTGGGRFLDGSFGTGVLEGTMPKSMQQRTQIYGTELDWLTAHIAQLLYPDANVKNIAFQDLNFPEGYFSVIGSNIPFGSFGVVDLSWKNSSDPVKKFAQGKIHNYFMVKKIDYLQPGGIGYIMTSNGIMDSRSNQIIRKFITDKCEVLGAVRLPDNTFKGAGTKVVADIIFLRKFKDEDDVQSSRTDDYIEKIEKPFLSSAKTDVDGTQIEYNAYYHEHPDMMIGTVKAGGQYRSDEFGLTSTLPTDKIANKLSSLIDKFVVPDERAGSLYDIHRPDRKVYSSVRESYIGNGNYVGDGNIVEQNGKIGILETQKDEDNSKSLIFQEVPSLLKNAGKIRLMIPLRETLKKLISSEIEGKSDDDLSCLRKDLKKEYNSYVSKFGRLHDKGNDYLLNDIDGYSLISLEVYKDNKFNGLSDIFEKSTIKPRIDLDSASNPMDMIALSLAEYGEIRPDYMISKLGPDWLTSCGDGVYELPTGGYQIKDLYLSGDVKAKLTEAKKFAELDNRFDRNVKALESVQPKDIPFVGIGIHMGARWVPDHVYSDFLRNMLGVEYDPARTGIEYSPEGDTFLVYIDSSETSGKANQWRTDHKKAEDLFSAALKDDKVTVSVADKDGNKVVLQEETDSANDKIQQIREKFEDYISSNRNTVKELERIYNDKFNTTVIPHFDGSHLQVPGLQGITLRPHQKDAIWMLINNRGGIIDHIVGAGKTLVMQCAIMEMRRMGIAKKPMIIALKSTVPQMAAEFRQAFPSARVLAPTEKDFTIKNRKKLLSNVALNDWDAVILSHEQYGKLPHTEEIESGILQEQIDQLEAAIEMIHGGTIDNLKKKELKGLEKRKESLTNKMKKLLSREVDREFTFENLGVDYLFVDECQQFKNLPYVTTHQNVAGLSSPEGSARATALLCGARYLQQLHQGDQGTILLSGTTISNSLVELYNLFQYVRPNKLKELGLNTFDAWAANFAVNSAELEYDYKNQLVTRSRFRTFDNVPELAKLYTEVADVRNDMNLNLPKPKMNVHVVTVPASPALLKIADECTNMCNNRNGSYFDIPDKSESGKEQPWALLATNISTKAAINVKLVDPTLDDGDGGKIKYVCDNVKKIYDKFSAQKGTQMIFCDLGVPGPGKEYDVYSDIINRLVDDYGIPRDEIVDIHVANTDKKRAALFKKMNDGEVRILIAGAKNGGTGVNVQKRMVAIHHVDMSWNPANVTQENGRGARQGNEVAKKYNDNKIEVFYYATEHSLDLYKYQLVSSKQNMIDKFKTGATSDERSFDEGSASDDKDFDPASVVALLSGNPIILEKAKTDKKVQRLVKLKRQYMVEHEQQVEDFQKAQISLENFKTLVKRNEKDLNILEKNGFKPDKSGKYPADVNIYSDKSPKEQHFDKPGEAGKRIHYLLNSGDKVFLQAHGMKATIGYPQSDINGKMVRIARLDAPSGIVYESSVSDDNTAAGVTMRRLLEKVITNSSAYKKNVEFYTHKVEGGDPGKPEFPREKELQDLLKEKKRIDTEFAKLSQDKSKSPSNTNKPIENPPADIMKRSAEVVENQLKKKRDTAALSNTVRKMKNGDVQTISIANDNLTDNNLVNWVSGTIGDGFKVAISKESAKDGHKDVLVTKTSDQPGDLQYRLMIEAATDIAEQLGGTPLHFNDENNLPEGIRDQVISGRIKGWYDPSDGSIHVFTPAMTGIEDVKRTVFHEKLGHEGLKALFGSDKEVTDFGNFIFHSAGHQLRRRIIERADTEGYGWDDPNRFSKAAQEVFSDIAADGRATIEEFSLWDRIKHFIIRQLDRIGLRIRGILNDHDLRYYVLKTGTAVNQSRESFKDWFGDWGKDPEHASKVVDKSGRPLQVYHGGDFNKAGRPIWFAEDPDYAKLYDFKKKWYNKGYFHTAYLNIRHPIDIDTTDVGYWQTGNETPEVESIPKLVHLGLDEKKLKALFDKIDPGWMWEVVNTKEFAGLCKEAGYDGIITREKGGHITYAVFKPDQIRATEFDTKKWDSMSADAQKEAAAPEFMFRRGKPRKGKNESMSHYFQRMRAWEKWNMADETAKINDDPMPDEAEFNEKYDKKFRDDLVAWKKDHGFSKEDEGPGFPPKRNPGESPQDYAIRVADYETKSDIWKNAPDQINYQGKAFKEYKEAYEAWKLRYGITDEDLTYQSLYDGTSDPNPVSDEQAALQGELDRRMDKDLCEGVGVSPDSAKQKAKIAIIERRKNIESASADDALYIHTIRKAIIAIAKSTGESRENISRDMTYLLEMPKRIEHLTDMINNSDSFIANRLQITPDDFTNCILPYVDNMNTASMAAAINEKHKNESGFAPISREYLDDKYVNKYISAPVLPKNVNLKITSEVQSTIDAIRDWYNYTYDWLKENNTLPAGTGYQRYYINHVWDKEASDPKAWAENFQRTQSPNQKKREVDTYMDGIDIGLVPKEEDITKLMAYYSRSNIEAWANRSLLYDMSNINVDIPNDEGEIKESLPVLMSYQPIDSNDYTRYNVPGVGDVWVLNEVRRRFASIFGTLRTQDIPSWLTKTGHAYDTTASTMKKIQLSFSGFHMLALSEVAMAQMRPDRALKALFKYIIWDSMKKGTLPAYAHPDDFQMAAGHLVQLGATQDYSASDVNAITDKLRKIVRGLAEEPGFKGAIGKIATPLASLLDYMNKGMDRVLWNYLHDGLKVACFKMFSEQIAQRVQKENLSPSQQEKLLDEAGQYVNDSFGGQYWELLNVSPALIKWMRRALLSPDWFVSTQRHFFSNFGFGSLYSEGGFLNYLRYNRDNIKRAFGVNIPQNELRRFRSKNAKLCYILGVCVFFYTTMNALNAFFRAQDEEKEKEKADEMRRLNPAYKSPYELAYPNGMKWYDYTMLGNVLGQQTHLFVGRYKDGSEWYARWGKQFREFPEMFIGRHGLDFPAPLVERMMGKANPVIGLIRDDLGALGIWGFSNSSDIQDIQDKYGKDIGLLAVNARHFLPFSLPTQKEKEFKLLDLFWPSQKGFTKYKTIDFFKTFIQSGDMKGVVNTYKAAVMNHIDAEKCLNAAITTLKATQREEMADGITDLPSAFKKYDNAKSLSQKKYLRNKLIKYLAASNYQTFTRDEAIQQVKDFVSGTDVVQKDADKYILLTNAEDIRDDYRLSALQKVARGYVSKVKDAETNGNEQAANRMADKYAAWFEINSIINQARGQITQLKKELGKKHDAEIMSDIRTIRKEAQQEIDRIKPPR